MPTKPHLLFVPTRGEIAVRIANTASELSLQTLTLHTTTDTAHTFSANRSIALSSASDFLDVQKIHSLAVSNGATLLHPGYGFLSESPELARLCEKSGIKWVGPTSDILALTGDKTAARKLAIECRVPVLPGRDAVTDVDDALQWANSVGYPVMLKAVAGGGGRGIRIISSATDLKTAFPRSKSESPGGLVFMERAAPADARHVEVQILGDGRGEVKVLGSRECSIQSRFQKVIEFAPAPESRKAEEYALAMAKHLEYESLGTFEFLVHGEEVWFMEINPRLQVEHTVTEVLLQPSDLVASQLAIATGGGMPNFPSPRGYAIQLRVTATGTGKIVRWIPAMGNGVRIDSHLRPGTTVGTDFDALIAKIVVHASTWECVVAKARRALRDTIIDGVPTNLGLLKRIVASADFKQQEVGIRWLENVKLPDVTEASLGVQEPEGVVASAPAASGPPLLRKGDTWALDIAGRGNLQLSISKLLQNDFPHSLAAEVVFGNSPAVKVVAKKGGVASKGWKKGSGKSGEVVLPFAGEVVEVGVSRGMEVEQGHILCVVRQMKTELEVRADKGGVVKWCWEVGVGDMVEGGELICDLEGRDGPKL